MPSVRPCAPGPGQGYHDLHAADQVHVCFNDLLGAERQASARQLAAVGRGGSSAPSHHLQLLGERVQAFLRQHVGPGWRWQRRRRRGQGARVHVYPWLGPLNPRCLAVHGVPWTPRP